MSIRETKFYGRLKPMFDSWGEIERVENVLGSGMPDVFYNFGGIGGWIETKVAKGDDIYFEKFQPNWMRRHLREGFRRIFIFVLDKNEHVYVFHAAVVASADLIPKDKWLTINMYSIRPSLVMAKPYNNKDALRSLLTT